jgi:thiopeptide-type bacteriocin biosynthesis protein
LSQLESFHFFILRTPVLSTHEALELIKSLEQNKDFSDETLETVFKLLELSASEFVERYHKYKNEKNLHKLVQYILRMSFRSTPFGLLAGVLQGHVADEKKIIRQDRDSWKFFYTDDGADIITTLKQQTVDQASLFCINPYCRMEGEFLVVPKLLLDDSGQSTAFTLQKYKLEQKSINSLDKLKENSFNKINFLKLFNSSQCEELLKTQIVLPYVDYARYILEKNHGWTQSSFLQLTTELKNKNIILKPSFTHCQVDQQTLSNVAIAVKKLHTMFCGQLNKLAGTTITGKIGNELMARKIFHDLPLIDILDPALGPYDPLDNRILYEESASYRNNEIINFYYEKIFSSAARLEEWALSPSDIEKLHTLGIAKQHRVSKMPSSVLAQISLLPKGKIYLKNVFGMPAQRYLSRFVATSLDLDNGLKSINDFDKKQNEDVIIAEVIDWPKDRKVANFGQRKIYTEYIIPISFPLSNWQSEKQIFISDLTVSYQYGRIRLRSKKLNKEIIPIFSNPYNLENEVNPYLIFLAELASQRNFARLNWMWTDLKTLPYLPRIRLGNVYLSLRTWRLSSEQYQLLTNSKNIVEDFFKIKNLLTLPDQFYWVEKDDQNLFVDTNMTLILKTFLDAYSKSLHSKTSYLIEYIDGLENELMIPLKNMEPIKQDPINEMPKENFRDKEIVNNKDVYLKCYINSQQENELLSNQINNFLESPLIKNKISRWFFIRYFDPSTHLRIRLYLKDSKDKALIIKELMILEKRLIDLKICWKFQTETYIRDDLASKKLTYNELETCYYFDSLRTMDLIKNFDLSKWTVSENARYALVLMDYYLSIKFKNLEEKIQFTNQARYAYRDMGYFPDEETQLRLKEIINCNKDLAKNDDDFLQYHMSKFLNKALIYLNPDVELTIFQRLIHLALNRTFIKITYLDEDMYYEALYKIYKMKYYNEKLDDR